MLSKSALRFLIDQATDGQVAWAPLDPIYDVVSVIGVADGMPDSL